MSKITGHFSSLDNGYIYIESTLKMKLVPTGWWWQGASEFLTCCALQFNYTSDMRHILNLGTVRKSVAALTNVYITLWLGAPQSHKYSKTLRRTFFKLSLAGVGSTHFPNSFYGLIHWGKETMDKSSFKLNFRHCGGLWSSHHTTIYIRE